MTKDQAARLEKLLRKQAQEVVTLLGTFGTDDIHYYLDPEIYILAQDKESLETIGPAAAFFWGDAAEWVFEVRE